jgi:transcriptional regulator with XRE-family HTH domain
MDLKDETPPQVGVADVATSLRREAGLWLKALREAQGLSQRQMAQQVGVNYYTFISQVESGRGRISPDRYRVWARALGIDPQEFVIRLMRFYDPVTHGILFGEGVEDQLGRKEH